MDEKPWGIGVSARNVFAFDNNATHPLLTYSGSTGYGRFTIDDFTEIRMMVLHPAKEPPYVLTSRLNGTT